MFVIKCQYMDEPYTVLGVFDNFRTAKDFMASARSQHLGHMVWLAWSGDGNQS